MAATFTPTNTHTGSGQGISIFEIIMTFIGLMALFFFFSMADGDDIKEYWVELMIIAFMAMGVFKTMFSKSPTPLNSNITVTDKDLTLTSPEITLPLSSLHFDTYGPLKGFERYHLWDDEGTLAIFSIEEDALSQNLADLRDQGTIPGKNYTVEHSSQKGHSVIVDADRGHRLHYTTESGGFELRTDPNKDPLIMHPTHFMVDPEFEVSDSHPQA